MLGLLLFFPVGLYFIVRRLGGRKRLGLAVAILSPIMLLVVIALATPSVDTNPSSAEASSKAHATTKTPAQLKAEKARARQRARANARAAKIARERARERARAHAAYVATANRWHRGYIKQDGNVYWRWRDGLSCADYVSNGCWHVEVTTRNGCSSYVAVNANEYRGNAIINALLDNQGFGIPPKTPRIFELDADAGNVSAGDVQIDCE